MTNNRRWLVIALCVLLVAVAFITRERVRASGGKAMAAAVAGYGGAVPVCRDRLLTIPEYGWDQMPKDNRVQAARALVNLCGNLWPWNEYNVVGAATQKPLATASRIGGVEIRAQ